MTLLLPYLWLDYAYNVVTRAFALLRWRSRPLRLFGTAVLMANLVLLALYFLHGQSGHSGNVVSSTLFSLGDQGLMEHLGYGLEITTALLFVMTARQTGQRFWFAWAIILGIVFCDDALHIHESIGRMFRDMGLMGKNMGEFIGFGLIGVPVLLIWLRGWRLRPQKAQDAVQTYWVYSFYLGALIFFGVFIDAFHAHYSYLSMIASDLFMLLEEGMEQILISLLCISSFTHWQETMKAPLPVQKPIKA